MPKISLAIVGYGTIGAGVVEIFENNRDLIRKRTGVDFEIKYLVDKDWTTPRRVEAKSGKKITDYREILKDKDVTIVVELAGGTGFAYSVIEDSLKAGKNVVTANKALLAEKGFPLFDLAREKSLAIGFEASVCGGIPIIRTISEGLTGDNVKSIYGIVNGTTNYILTKMTEEKQGFDTALKQAQKLGFAEADPSLDIGGNDAAHKIAILSSLAFNTAVRYDQVYIEGISGVELEDVANAQELGYVLKLLAIARLDADNSVEVRVNPTLVPLDNQLASVRNEFNAVLVESEYLGNSMYFGRGAGSRPTATAVAADIIDIGIFINDPTKTTKYLQFNQYPVKPIGNISSRYYVRFNIVDKPGILSKISGIFGNHNISIASVIQKERSTTNYVPLIMTTHEARESDIVKALDEIEKEAFNKKRGVMLRIID